MAEIAKSVVPSGSSDSAGSQKSRELASLLLTSTVSSLLAGALYAKILYAPGGEIPVEAKEDGNESGYNIETRLSGDAAERDFYDIKEDPEKPSVWETKSDVRGTNGDLFITIWFFKYMAFVFFLCSSLTGAVIYRFVSNNIASDDQLAKFKSSVGWALALPVQKLGLGGGCFFLHIIMVQWQNASWASDQTGGNVIGMIVAAVIFILFLAVIAILEKGPKTAEFRK